MSSERLRLAAKKLRGVVDEAQCKCGGPVCGPEKWFKRGELESRMDGSEETIPLLLTMSPTVALALADWLDSTARRIDERYAANREVNPALAVANAILGEDA